MAMNRNSKNKSKKLGIVVGILVAVVLILTSVLIMSLIASSRESVVSQIDDAEIAETVDLTPVDVEDTGAESQAHTIVHSSKYQILPNESGAPVAQIDVDFDELIKENPDVCGWIYIPDTDINCAIVCNDTDPNYYSMNNIENVSGVFMQNYNSKDFSDRMTVVYGKNQDGNSQFKDLFKYKDLGFYNDHEYIYISTKDKDLTYKVFAAHKAYAEHLMIGYDWSVDQVFLDYLILLLQGDDVDPNANLNAEAEITINDRVITLSEKIDGEDDYRYLVQGMLINESPKETH